MTPTVSIAVLLSSLACKDAPTGATGLSGKGGFGGATLAPYEPYTTGYGPYGDVAYSDTGYIVPDGAWTDTGRSGGSGAGTCPEPASYGACEPPGANIPDSFDVLTFGWGSDLGSNPQWWFELVEDQATWDLRVAAAEDLSPLAGGGSGAGSHTPAPVDFATHRVVIVGYRQDASCGMFAEGVTATAGVSGPAVVATVSDASFGCCRVQYCVTRGIAQAIAVPRSAGIPSGCVEVEGAPGCL